MIGLAYAHLDGLPAQQVVEFYCLVRRDAILVLRRVLADPEEEVEEFLVRLHVRVQDDKRVTVEELTALLLWPTIDAEVGLLAVH